ncbi:hypothetical protein L218DRAFT_1067215, partial [Marasmius fiardii PR-910]
MATRTTTNTKPNTGSSNVNAKGKTPASGPSTTANQRNPAMSTPASSTNTEDKRASKASESNGSSDTIRNPSVVPSPSHSNSAGNSLFGASPRTPSVSNSAMFDEANRVAIERGHRSIQALQAEGNSEAAKNASTTTSYVEEQGVHVDGNMIYHERRPDIRQVIRPIEDVEIERLRPMHPEPFSEDDPNPNRRPNQNSASSNNKNIRVRGWNGHTVPYQPKNNQLSPPGGDDRELPPHMNRNNGSRGNGGGGPPGNDPPSDHGDGYSSSTPSDHSDNEENCPEYGRRPSEDPKMMQKKDWTYDPTPQSEAEKSTLAQIMEAALALEQSEKSCEYYEDARKRLQHDRRYRSRSRSKERKNRHESFKRGYVREGSPSRLQVVDRRRYKVRSRSPRRDDRPLSYPLRPKDKDRFRCKFEPKDNRPFVKRDFQQFNGKSKDSPQTGDTFRMMGEDGKVRLCRIVEINESEDMKAQEVVSGSENENPQFDRDDESVGDKVHSLSSYGGSQYESGDDSERAGFMRDEFLPYDSDPNEYYTLRDPSERLCGGWESSDFETHYESCESALSSEDEDEFEKWSPKDSFFEYLRAAVDESEDNQRRELNSIPGMKRPARTYAEKRCLAGWMTINGVRAFTLFDSGSTADAISPDFAK